MLDSIKFDDATIFQEQMSWLNAYAQKSDYKSIKEQCESDLKHSWGHDLNVLIISDRCPGRAIGLYEYLMEKTNLSSISQCRNFAEAKVCITHKPIDILIFVGFQKNNENYEIKKILEEKKPDIYTVMYASLDDCIKGHCVENKIQYAFSSRKPVAEFIDYLDNSYLDDLER